MRPPPPTLARSVAVRLGVRPEQVLSITEGCMYAEAMVEVIVRIPKSALDTNNGSSEMQR